MRHKSLLLLGSLVALMGQAQTTVTIDEASNMSASKTYREVGIHDPSVYYSSTDKTYYMIGSHIGFAKTTDLLNLTNIGSSGIYTKGYAQEFKSCPEHTVQVTRDGVTTSETLRSLDAGAFCATYAGIKVGDREPTTEAGWIAGDQWAPDMIYNPNLGKWCMYLSLNGDNWASVIVMLTSDSPSGPFAYEAPIVCGGFNGQSYSGIKISYQDTDLELVLGELSELPSRYNTSRWGDLWPNCIDPCVFFDDNDELWLTYGSWSGGIFMLKLDKNTGLRDYTTNYPMETYKGTGTGSRTFTGYDSDPYFGKHIAGGCYVSGEAPYIQKIGDYYYLFVTYGGLAPDGGYEMRIFRSKNPDGPYSDGTGASAKYTQYTLNYGPKAGTNKGLKVLGSMNGWGSMTVGECAEGHNSAIVDPDGDAFLVYHTKFNNGTQGFEVRTRQLFVNEQGWLVASPFRYTGKQTRQADIDSRRLFTPEEIAGEYKLIIHPYKLDHSNMAEATPVNVTFTADGQVTGDRTGTWTYSKEDQSYVTLRVNNGTYYGVFMNQKVDGYNDIDAVAITAVGNGGAPMWLYKLTPKSAVADAYRIVKTYLGSANTPVKDNAPAIDNVDVTFTVCNAATGEEEPETLSPDGIYTPTADGHDITIAVELRSGDYVLHMDAVTRHTRSENYEPQNGVYYPESQQKNLNAGWWSNFSTEDYVLAQGDKAEFHFINYSDASDNWHNWALYGASDTHGGSNYTEYFGIRCDNWDNTTGSNSGCTSDFNWDTFKDDMNGSRVDMTASYGDDGVFDMSSKITTEAGKVYNYSYKKEISSKPGNITLFFVNEKSYIDGAGLEAGVSNVSVDKATTDDGRTFNLWGIEVDSSYKGIVIRNGRKYIQR